MDTEKDHLIYSMIVLNRLTIKDIITCIGRCYMDLNFSISIFYKNKIHNIDIPFKTTFCDLYILLKIPRKLSFYEYKSMDYIKIEYNLATYVMARLNTYDFFNLSIDI